VEDQYFQSKELVSDKSKGTAAVLCFFLGVFGAHRFYVGQVGMGFLYLFTLGLFGIGDIVDFIMILCGSFKDKNGAVLK
jgi:TM2 domain-containing membrane protein YozV